MLDPTKAARTYQYTAVSADGPAKTVARKGLDVCRSLTTRLWPPQVVQEGTGQAIITEIWPPSWHSTKALFACFLT